MRDSRQQDPENRGQEMQIERNLRRAQEVIEARKRSQDEGKARQPGMDDPQRVGDDAPPNQWNMPSGGQSGPNSQGGSSKRHKP